MIMKSLSAITETHGLLQDDLAKLAESFKLLKETTEQVSTEATNTALFIKDQLKDTTYRFYSVIDSVSDLIIIKDSEGRWKTLNAFGQSLYGLNKGDYFNKTDLDLAKEYPLLSDGFAYCYETDKKAWETHTYYREIESFVIENQLRYFDIIKTPIFHKNGSKKELVVIGRDITEFKTNEFKNKAFIAAINSASDNILIIDPNGVVMFCNDAVIKTFGFNAHSCIEGQKISIISSDTMPKEIFKDLWVTVRSNNVWTGIIVNKHTSGYLINCKVTAIPVMNGEPEPIYYICTMKILNN